MAMLSRLRHRRLIIALAATVTIAVTAMAAPWPNRPEQDRLAPADTSRPVGMLSSGPGPQDQRQTQPPHGRRPSEPASSEGSGGFIYRSGRFRPLSSVPGASMSLTHGINNRGQTSGLYVDADAVPGPDGALPDGSFHGFVRDRRGHITSFDVPDARYTRPLGINNRGQLAGDYADAGTVPGPDGLQPPGTIHGFTRDRRGHIRTFDVPFRLHVIRGLNDRGQIVGYYDNPDLTQGAFMREPTGRTTPITYPGADYTQAYGINNRGQLVGAYLEPGATLGPDGTAQPGTVHGFIWERGRFITLDVPDATLTQAFGINNRGQIVGGYRDTNGHPHGFLLSHGRYRTIDAPDRPNNVGTMATTINDLGELVIPESIDDLVPVAT
jgi:probable HAF family extracellular repeat protein